MRLDVGRDGGLVWRDFERQTPSEETRLTAFNFPNWAEVEWTGETRKANKKRAGTVGRWLKEFENDGKSAGLYSKETRVIEGGKSYWIICRDRVVTTLEERYKKGEAAQFALKIPGYIRKDGVTAYLLVADVVAYKPK